MSLQNLIIWNGGQRRQHNLPSSILPREWMAIIESQMTVDYLSILLPSSSLQPKNRVLQEIIHSLPAYSEGQTRLQTEHTHSALDKPDSAPFESTLSGQSPPSSQRITWNA